MLRPGGKLVIVDYHRPAGWHPLKPLLREVFRWLEPFAIDLWRHPLEHYLPANGDVAAIEQQRIFGGVYQLCTITRR